MGSVLSHLSPANVAPLIDALIDTGTDGYWVAVEILDMYAYPKLEGLEEFRPQIRRMMANFEVSELGDTQTVMNAHHFGRIAIWLVRHGSRDEDAAVAAEHFSEQFVKLCNRSLAKLR
jgi:hypothetical protein